MVIVTWSGVTTKGTSSVSAAWQATGASARSATAMRFVMRSVLPVSSELLPVGLAAKALREEIDEGAHLRRHVRALRIHRVDAERLQLVAPEDAAQAPGPQQRRHVEAGRGEDAMAGNGGLGKHDAVVDAQVAVHGHRDLAAVGRGEAPYVGEVRVDEAVVRSEVLRGLGLA